MAYQASSSLGRVPTLSEFTMLRPGDRVILDWQGDRRLAKVAHHAMRGGVRIIRVWLHRKGRIGFCNGQTSVRRHQIVDVTYCSHLNISAASLEPELVGGAV